MSSETMPPRWLIVVKGEKLNLYENLRQSFEPDTRVDVILDRRRADRRMETVPVGTEPRPQRRREQRRKPPPAEEVAFWENSGFCLIYERTKTPSSTEPKRNPPGRKSGSPPRRRLATLEGTSQG